VTSNFLLRRVGPLDGKGVDADSVAASSPESLAAAASAGARRAPALERILDERLDGWLGKRRAEEKKDLPDGFGVLRRLLEARLGKAGKREFVQVLRLLEVFPREVVTAAVGDALARGVIGFDAIKHLVLCRIEWRPPRLDLTLLSLPAQGRGPDDVTRRLSEPAGGTRGMSATPQVLLGHHLKVHDKVARQCAAEGVDHVRDLLRLAELGMIVLELARCEYLARRENVIALGNADPAS
jgi:hypothetical protein